MNFRASLAFALLSIVGVTSFGPVRVDAVDYNLVDSVTGTTPVNSATYYLSDYVVAPLSNGQSIAQEFETFSVGGLPGSGFPFYLIKGVSINMFQSQSGTGTLELSMYSNNGATNLPNQKLATLGTFDISTISSDPNTMITTGELFVPTTLNTKYWIVASLTSATGKLTFNLPGNSPTSAYPASASKSFFSVPTLNTFEPWTAYNSTGTWAVTGDNKSRDQVAPLRLIVTIPEPSTYAFAAISAVSLAAVARRRVKA